MGFSRQEYWSGSPFPSPGDLPNPGTEPGSLSLQADLLLSEAPGKHPLTVMEIKCTVNHPPPPPPRPGRIVFHEIRPWCQNRLLTTVLQHSVTDCLIKSSNFVNLRASPLCHQPGLSKRPQNLDKFLQCSGCLGVNN